jgi:hypothetical protein
MISELTFSAQKPVFLKLVHQATVVSTISWPARENSKQDKQRRGLVSNLHFLFDDHRDDRTPILA